MIGRLLFSLWCSISKIMTISSIYHPRDSYVVSIITIGREFIKVMLIFFYIFRISIRLVIFSFSHVSWQCTDYQQEDHVKLSNSWPKDARIFARRLISGPKRNYNITNSKKSNHITNILCFVLRAIAVLMPGSRPTLLKADTVFKVGNQNLLVLSLIVYLMRLILLVVTLISTSQDAFHILALAFSLSMT